MPTKKISSKYKIAPFEKVKVKYRDIFTLLELYKALYEWLGEYGWKGVHYKDHAKDGADEGRYKIYKSVVESKDQVDLNHNLMQLKEVDIAGSIKMMIHDKVTGPVDKLNTFQFKKMFMSDKMYTVIKDLDSWLATSFNTLNAYRSLGYLKIIYYIKV